MSDRSDARWMPTASLGALKQAAVVRHAIRQWMQAHDILEVSTPAISHAATTDPQVESLVIKADAGHSALRYLHSSPEFAMKRLLCAYPGQDIYQIAPVFRSEEQGRYHVSQFSMLEWYRTGMDHRALMHDVESLLMHIWAAFDRDFPGVQLRSYSQEVFDRLGQWPDELSVATIEQYFVQHARSFPAGLDQDIAASLDLFMDEFVLPGFDKTRITFLFEYPGSQAALARVANNAAGRVVAERFEVYRGQVELANGFHELADADTQQRRFEHDLQVRKARGQSTVPIDNNLLDALASGLPDCAGIALGLDRLLMVLGDYTHISQVLSFCDDNA